MSNFKSIIKSKTFIVLGSLIFIFLIVIITRQLIERHQINSEIAQLQKQASDLQKKSNDLQNFISYLNTDDYKEKTARNQLNLQKNGEFVYSFADQGNSNASPDISQAQPNNLISEQSNVSDSRKWWNYFFNN